MTPIHIASVVIVTLAITITIGQKHQIFNGSCPKVTPITAFNQTKFAGEWYEIQRFNNTLIYDQCGAPDYKWAKDHYDLTYKLTNITSNTRNTTSYELWPHGPVYDGLFDVYFKSNKTKTIPQFVLGTDYGNYTVLWGCEMRTTDNIQRAFILSRKPKLSSTLLKTAQSILQRFYIDTTKLVNVVQDKCGTPGGGSGGNGSASITQTMLLLPVILSALIFVLIEYI